MPLRKTLDNLNHDQLVDRLDLALEGAALGIWDWDLRANHVQFDRRWCEMLGLVHAETPMELATWESRVHPDDLARCYVDINAYLRGERAHYENIHRMRHADGRWIYILDRGRISEVDGAGAPIRFTGTHFDCTATEEARRVLEDQQSLLTGLLRDLPTAVAMVGPDGRYLATNERWDAWFGQGAGAVGARPEELGRPLPAAWVAALEAAHQGRPSGPHEARYQVNGAAQGRWLRWSVWPGGKTESGGPFAILRFDDITEELGDRARRESEARLSSLGTLAGGIAHELNTPLQTLVLNSRLALEEVEQPEADLELLKEILSESLFTVGYLADLVTAMRMLRRESSGDALEPVAVGALLSQVSRLCNSRFRSKGVRLELSCPDPSLAVPAREAELAQVLVSLLANAFDAALDSADPWVRLSAEATAEGGGRILVQDSGAGVPEGDSQSIMEPFFTTKGPGRGAGLGLSLGLSLAQGMGASLCLEEGAVPTTFSLTFPALVLP